MFINLKKDCANMTAEETAKMALELGYNTPVWNSRTFKAKQYRDIVTLKLAEQYELDTSNPKHFNLLMKLTDELL